MKSINLLIGLNTLTLILLMGCWRQRNNDKETDTNAVISVTSDDSTSIMMAFEDTKVKQTFLKDVGLEEEAQFGWNDNLHKIVRGDLDGDGTADALLGFSIESRGGGNNFDMHYATFLNKDDEWKYSGQLDGSIVFEDRFYAVEKIENGMIKGNWKGIKDESLMPYAAEYVLKNGQLVNTFTALHKTENVEREYLYVAEILTPENSSVRITANVKEYEKLLGKGKISMPQEQPECGTYFDEGTTRYLDYRNLRFELNDENKAALISVEFKKGIKLQTDKGTITENTKLEELKNIFYQKDSWIMLDEENGIKTFAIPDEAGSDNQWHFDFDKNGKLLRLSLFIPC